jgi:hypothetical protein
MRRCVVWGLALAAVGGAGVLAEATLAPRRALFAWIAAYGFIASVALGALLLVMIMQVAHATWFVVLRPLCGAIASVVVVLAPLFVPLALGIRAVYPWARPLGLLDEDVREAVALELGWMNPRFFLVRSLIYLGTWSTLSIALRRDAARGVLSAPGIPIVAFTLTFAAFDWILSLNAGWTSDIFGLYVFAGGFSAALGTLAVLAWLARRAGILPDEVRPDTFHALGRVLLTSVILWTYIAFVQLLLIWIGNLPHEISFYLARSRGDWKVFDFILFFGRFLGPFFALLSRPLKRDPALLALVGAWIVLMNAVDFEWLVLPALSERFSLLDIAPFAAALGSSFAFGAWRFFSHAKVPTQDPDFAESLHYESP